MKPVIVRGAFLSRVGRARPVATGGTIDGRRVLCRTLSEDADQAGEKIEGLFTRNMKQPYVLQRLTDRSYFFQRFFYSTTFYVGESGVLLLDALEGRGPQLLQAIREVTPLPVTMIVYSHFHVDHVGGGQFWVEEAQRAGKELRIIASKATADKMAFMNSQLPKPTLVLANLTSRSGSTV